ncbi:MAG: glycosyltransferase family 4 protein [Chloroflexi bacterium]|nr:glycosyltransferase family 4 protein [Chloroflexota bacterium]
MLRIGIDARLTYYRQGGIAASIRHLIEELPHIDTQNQYIILHSRKDQNNLATAPNQKRAICWTPSHHRWERYALAVEVAPRRLDLLHSPDFIPPVNGAYRSIITIHDLTFLHYPQFLTEESRRYYNDQIEAAVRRADHILCDSDATRNDVLNMLPVSEEKATTVWLGLSNHFYRPSEPTIATFCDQHQLSRGYLLFVGTFEPRKNLPGLLQAYHSLRSTLPDSPKLVIAGRRGWLYDEALKRATNLGLSDHVVWLENVPYDDLPALYSAASLLCLPSFYEGFGFPPLEAMACGTPTVVANRASLPELVGEAAILVDPDDPDSIADAMTRILTDSNLATSLRARGLERIELFSWRRCAQQTHDIYLQVLSS